MKHIIAILVLMVALASCTSSNETKDSNQSSSKEVSEKKSSHNPDVILEPINTDEALIATALMAAPKASRANCKVIGFNMAGEFVTFREGTNEFIVLADDPNKKGFNAACYHKDLEPFMARGRQLRAEGKTTKEIFDIREQEARSGDLDMGTPGATLHIYYGNNTKYNPKTSEVDGAKYRYVVYLPFATAASTGLPEAPIAANHPWIMNPGTHRAHIMISPKPEASN